MRNIFCPIIFILFFSCADRQTNTSLEALGDARYIIDLDVNKEACIPYSSVFKNVKTIILENNEDALIGRVHELQVFDGCIYILDKTIARSLLVFDENGRFIRKIGRMGRGPGEYFLLDDFTLDTENGVVFLLDFSCIIHKYRLDGTYIHSIDTRDQIPGTNIYFIQYYNDRLYASVLARGETTPDDFMLLEMDPDNGKVLSRSLPLKDNKGWDKRGFTGHNFFISPLNNPPKYTQLFMDSIVSLGEEITPYIELKSQHLTTEKDFENLSNDKSTTGSIDFQVLQGTSKIWDVNSFVESDDFILFKYKSGVMSGKRGSFSVLFQKETESVKIAHRMENDLVYRRIDDENQPSIPVSDGSFLFSDKKGAYEIIQTSLSLFLEEFQKSIKNNEVVPELDKLDELLQLNEESNPIIFYYEFK